MRPVFIENVNGICTIEISEIYVRFLECTCNCIYGYNCFIEFEMENDIEMVPQHVIIMTCTSKPNK